MKEKRRSLGRLLGSWKKYFQRKNGNAMWVWQCQIETNTKNLGFFGSKQNRIFFETELEQLYKQSEDGQNKYLNAFLISLAISFVGPGSKILSMSWYTSMKPFQNILGLVMTEYLCIWHDYSLEFNVLQMIKCWVV